MIVPNFNHLEDDIREILIKSIYGITQNPQTAMEFENLENNAIKMYHYNVKFAAMIDRQVYLIWDKILEYRNNKAI